MCVREGSKTQLCNLQTCSSEDGSTYFSERQTTALNSDCPYGQQTPCLPGMEDKICWQNACGDPRIALAKDRNFFISLQNTAGNFSTPHEQVNLWLEGATVMNENLIRIEGYQDSRPQQLFATLQVGGCFHTDDSTAAAEAIAVTDDGQRITHGRLCVPATKTSKLSFEAVMHEHMHLLVAYGIDPDSPYSVVHSRFFRLVEKTNEHLYFTGHHARTYFGEDVPLEGYSHLKVHPAFLTDSRSGPINFNSRSRAFSVYPIGAVSSNWYPGTDSISQLVCKILKDVGYVLSDPTHFCIESSLH